MQQTAPENLHIENMFLMSSEFDKKYEVFPEAAMKNLPIYKTAEKYTMFVYRLRKCYKRLWLCLCISGKDGAGKVWTAWFPYCLFFTYFQILSTWLNLVIPFNISSRRP